MLAGQKTNKERNPMKETMTPPAQTSGIKKLNLSGIARSAEKPGKEYPVLPDPEDTARYFRQSFELRINGDEIPEAEAETLIEEIQALFARHNATSALTAKAIIKPTKEFHTARHTAFAPDQNLEIDRIVPVIAMVKTKLGKGGE
jgi:hypothetical protein